MTTRSQLRGYESFCLSPGGLALSRYGISNIDYVWAFDSLLSLTWPYKDRKSVSVWEYLPIPRGKFDTPVKNVDWRD